MAKSVDETLVTDIYALMGSGHRPLDTALSHLGEAMAAHIARSMLPHEKRNTLRGSNIGTQCDRKLWYTVNEPNEEEEETSPWAKNKFLYGHILEELVLFQAEQAGHDVKHRQLEVSLDGVYGHIDAVIGRRLVDAKSANSRGMLKFRNHELETDDPFGYLDQLRFYHAALSASGVDLDDKISFLVIDKELGHIVVDTYDAYPIEIVRDKLTTKKKMLEGPMPNRAYFAIPDGKSGNMQLDVPCRYCPRKKQCWPTLKVYAYANGPRYLTKVVREPDVPQIKG